MSRTQMQQAQQLIQQGRYDEARRILEKLDTPAARDALAQLNQRAPRRARRRSSGGGVLGRILGFLLTIIISAGITIAVLAGLVIATAPPSRGGAFTIAPTSAPTEIAEFVTPSATPDLRTGVVISAQSINVRSNPSTSANAIASLISGTTVEIIGESDDGNWYQIRLPDGRTGWVAASLLDAEPAPTSVAQAVTDTPQETPTPSDVCTPAEAQAWYDANRTNINPIRFALFQAEDAQSSGQSLNYQALIQSVRENRSTFEQADYPGCVTEARAAFLVGFQALVNSLQNRMNNFANEANSELNIARQQIAAADALLADEAGVQTSRTDCVLAEIWYAGIEADVTEFLTTIENVGLDTPPSNEIRTAIFDLGEIRTRLDAITVPPCANTASNHLKSSVASAVRFFQAIMAEESTSSKQTQLAAMVSAATQFIEAMRELGIRVG